MDTFLEVFGWVVLVCGPTVAWLVWRAWVPDVPGAAARRELLAEEWGQASPEEILLSWEEVEDALDREWKERERVARQLLALHDEQSMEMFLDCARDSRVPTVISRRDTIKMEW